MFDFESFKKHVADITPEGCELYPTGSMLTVFMGQGKVGCPCVFGISFGDHTALGAEVSRSSGGLLNVQVLEEVLTAGPGVFKYTFAPIHGQGTTWKNGIQLTDNDGNILPILPTASEEGPLQKLLKLLYNENDLDVIRARLLQEIPDMNALSDEELFNRLCEVTGKTAREVGEMARELGMEP